MKPKQIFISILAVPMEINNLTKIFTFASGLALCTFVPCLSESAGAATFITFDAPGAGTTGGQGTLPQGINPDGAITGFIRNVGVPSGTSRRGFLRDKDGTFTMFDAPGAGIADFQGTRAYSINPGGTITGWYIDATNVEHAYVRAKDGTFTVFDAVIPGPYPQGTFPFNNSVINAEGAITGNSTDAGNVNHGFVRAIDGTITTFDVPGAGTGAGQGTLAFSINSGGAITGYDVDASFLFHGFVRAIDGTITTFDAPGAGTVGDGFQGTFPFSINPEGAITGYYGDTNDVFHGFVRAKDGTITTFDPPGAGAGAGQGTFPVSINPSGAITGNYVDASNVNHGFVRAKDGTITAFDVPGAGAGAFQGTVGVSIAPDGAITGNYVDASDVIHGFLRSP